MRRCWRRWPGRGSAPTSSRAANMSAPAPPASPPEKIVFSGVGKTEAEMAEALKGGLYQFNLESDGEAETLSAVATSLGITAPVGFRVNPDVEAGTHAKISTGGAENKFGIPIDTALAAYRRAAGVARARGPGRRRPYRQPAHQPGAAGNRLPKGRRADRRIARRGARDRGRRSRRRARHPPQSGAARPAEPAGLWRDGPAHRRRLGCAAGVRAGPADRRQCRHTAEPRDPGEAGHRAPVPDRRCRDERL